MASRQLKPYEENYPTHDLNLAAVIFTLKIWRHYLLGDQVLIYTDYKEVEIYLYSKGTKHEAKEIARIVG